MITASSGGTLQRLHAQTRPATDVELARLHRYFGGAAELRRAVVRAQLRGVAAAAEARDARAPATTPAVVIRSRPRERRTISSAAAPRDGPPDSDEHARPWAAAVTRKQTGPTAGTVEPARTVTTTLGGVNGCRAA